MVKESVTQVDRYYLMTTLFLCIYRQIMVEFCVCTDKKMLFVGYHTSTSHPPSSSHHKY